jgi:hypothetical protein
LARLGQAHRELIVDRTLGYDLGDTLRLGDDTYEVVGVTQGFVSSGGDALVVATERDAAAILGWMAPESRRLAPAPLPRRQYGLRHKG